MPRVLEWGMSDRRSSPYHVTVATPAYGDVLPEYALCLAGTARELEFHGIAFSIRMIAGDCHVDDARNHLVRNFLETESDFLFFVDADLKWKPEDFLRVLSAPRPFVLGCYPYKGKEGYPVFFESRDLWADEHGLIECLGGPTGFMRLHRDVLQAVYDAEGERFYARADDPDKRLPLKPVFMREIGGERRRGGDTAFCRKWRALGGKVHLLPDIDFTHLGTNGWRGNFAGWVERPAAPETVDRGVAHAIEALRAGFFGLDHFRTLAGAWGNKPWAATPEYLQAACEMALKTPPEATILECGSGLSTVVLACAAEGTRRRLVTLEHDPGFYERTALWLEALDLKADLRLAEIDPATGWYAYAPEAPPGLIVIDGPPRHLKTDRLYPLRRDWIGKAHVLIDDAYAPVAEQLKAIDGFWEVSGLGERPACVGRVNVGPGDAALSVCHPQAAQ